MTDKKKKILVTGGAGYIGSILVKELLNKGYDVRVFDSLIFGKDHLTGIQKKFELIKGDVRNFPLNALKGCSSVIHMGSLSNDPTAELTRKPTTRSTAKGRYASPKPVKNPA